MRLAHFSDLHLLSLEGASAIRFLNKRITGLATLRLRRKSVHKPFAVRAIAEEIRRVGVDHVAVTGDLTNLALEPEFELVRRFFDDELGLPPERVSVVPGNHDVYTRGSAKAQRFSAYLGDYLTSDLPEFGVANEGGRFPFVKLRGPLAIIGLSTAVARSPLMAAGQFGAAQLDQLAKLLRHPEVERRGKVLLQHHPMHDRPSRLIGYLEGLHDAPAMAKTLRSLAHGLILHGHLHRRVRRSIETEAGRVDVIGATSASLISAHAHRHAGFNLYGFDEVGRLTSVEAHVLGDDGKFAITNVPVEAPSEHRAIVGRA
jgi:3',5'-cyclic AMP phosphodiesterase CpdA